ncbi:FAD dependent oxidoreductase [Xylariaceae sp. FL0804]|nr:FAD dependent oxidoreductase [Xylariaceae sp. FL0804]
MEARAAIPVDLPSPNPTQSYWQLDAAPIADLRSTEALPGTTDTVVIGSGITGAAVAFGLLEEHGAKDVVMLEARQACSGATGRNGGHTKAASYRTFGQHARTLGTRAACQIARLELANIRAVHGFARRHGLDCDSAPGGTVDVVYDAAQWAEDVRAVAALRDALPDGDDAAAYATHSPAEVRDRFFCGGDGDEEGGVCGAISYEAGSVSAYKFTVGVLGLCLQRGLNLQTNTPVLDLRRDGAGRWLVVSARGTVSARRVVVATNGYTARLLRRFQGVVVPLRGHVSAQRPGRNMPAGGLPATYSFVYGDGYDYMVQRPRGCSSEFEGDLVLGGGYRGLPGGRYDEYGTTDDAGSNDAIYQTLRDSLPRYFGDSWGEDDADGRVRAQWTGIMGYSADGMPFVGEMPGEKELWVACSFQGHGMVLCWMCARALVAMMEGSDDERLREWFPEAYRISEERLNRRFEDGAHI